MGQVADPQGIAAAESGEGEMSARHIQPLTMEFTAEVARMVRLGMTQLQISGVLKCKAARVEWAVKKLRVEAEKGKRAPHRPHLGVPFHGARTAYGEAVSDPGPRYREPEDYTFEGRFEDHPKACRPEPIWRPCTVQLP